MLYTSSFCAWNAYIEGVSDGWVEGLFFKLCLYILDTTMFNITGRTCEEVFIGCQKKELWD